jgi:hypothetical protein
VRWRRDGATLQLIWMKTIAFRAHKRNREYIADLMAERVGFEPTVEFPQHTLSKRAP